MIEAAIVGKSVLTVLGRSSRRRARSTSTTCSPRTAASCTSPASLDEHVAQLATVLDEDEADAERRRAFVESFVRPHGLDRPATPILADAVEELAGVRAAPSERGSTALRAGLAVEAALSSLYAGGRFAARSWRRRRSGAPGEAGAPDGSISPRTAMDAER